MKLSEDSKESRDEATQTHRGMEELYRVQCDSESRPTVRTNLYLIWLLIGSQWRSKSKGMTWAGFGALQMRRVEQLITLSNYQGEPEESQREYCKNQARKRREKTGAFVASK